MPKLGIFSGGEIIRIMEAGGFVGARQKGSHLIMQKRTDGGTITVPVPLHRTVRIGTLQSGISARTFLPLSFKTCASFWKDLVIAPSTHQLVSDVSAKIFSRKAESAEKGLENKNGNPRFDWKSWTGLTGLRMDSEKTIPLCILPILFILSKFFSPRSASLREQFLRKSS